VHVVLQQRSRQIHCSIPRRCVKVVSPVSELIEEAFRIGAGYVYLFCSNEAKWYGAPLQDLKVRGTFPGSQRLYREAEAEINEELK